MYVRVYDLLKTLFPAKYKKNTILYILVVYKSNAVNVYVNVYVAVTFELLYCVCKGLESMCKFQKNYIYAHFSRFKTRAIDHINLNSVFTVCVCVCVCVRACVRVCVCVCVCVCKVAY